MERTKLINRCAFVRITAIAAVALLPNNGDGVMQKAAMRMPGRS